MEDDYYLPLPNSSDNIIVTTITANVIGNSIKDYVIDLPPDYEVGVSLLQNLKVDLLIVPIDGRFSIIGAEKIIDIASKFVTKDNIMLVRNKIMPHDILTKSELNEIKLLGVNMYHEGIPSHNVFRRAENKGVPVWSVPYGVSTNACRVIDSFTDAIVNKYFKLRTTNNMGVK